MDEDEKKWRSYESAQNLARSEATNVWQRFYVFLALNTFLLGATVLSAPVVLKPVLGAVGLFICFLWLAMSKRGFTYFKYYFRYAREREKLLDGHDLLQRGEMLGNGKEIEVDRERLRMPWSARVLLAQRAAYLMVYIFILAYVALAALGAYEWCRQK